MSAYPSVLGVLGVCWVDSVYSTQQEPTISVSPRPVCWVCWVCRRVRACVTLITPVTEPEYFPYARTNKPSQPNTLNTHSYKSLNLKAVSCVGFVLGMGFSVLGWFCRGNGQ